MDINIKAVMKKRKRSRKSLIIKLLFREVRQGSVLILKHPCKCNFYFIFLCFELSYLKTLKGNLWPVWPSKQNKKSTRFSCVYVFVFVWSFLKLSYVLQENTSPSLSSTAY